MKTLVKYLHKELAEQFCSWNPTRDLIIRKELDGKFHVYDTEDNDHTYVICLDTHTQFGWNNVGAGLQGSKGR
tara:strand:+ start:255 stop:473 length:219 start_codon:yes stop_codon:yes gene_type:complete